MAYFVIETGQNGTEPKTADCSILVEDTFQSQGLGRVLLHCLIQQPIAKNLRS